MVVIFSKVTRSPQYSSEPFIASAILLTNISLAAFAGGDKVYVTDGGKKYHKKNCSVVKTGKSETTLDEAKKKGYSPCNVCYKGAK